MLLGLALAVLVGLSLGLLGGGGSILTVPIFVYVLGYGGKEAIAMSLPVVGITSLVGAARHWRSHNVELRAALLFAPVAMAGAFAGARIAALLTAGQQLLLLGVAMLAAAVAMFRRRSGSAPDEPHGRRAPAVVALVAAGVGVLTGIVGIGGGFMIVPALVLLGGVPMKRAIGTSLLVIGFNALAGMAGYLGQVAIDWPFVAAFTGVAIAGTLGGVALVRFVAADTLRKGFAVFLLFLGALVFYQNRNALTPGTAAATEEEAP